MELLEIKTTAGLIDYAFEHHIAMMRAR